MSESAPLSLVDISSCSSSSYYINEHKLDLVKSLWIFALSIADMTICQVWMIFVCSRQNLILESFLSASTVYSLSGVELTDKIMT